MDNIVPLYTTTDGRISRKTWWLGAIGIGVINIIVAMLIFPMVGLGMPDAAQIAANAEDPAAVSAMIGGALRASGWASLILFLIFAYPIYAISVKRRHDKANDGKDVIGYLALTVLLLLMQALGIGYETTTIGEISVPTPSILLTVISVAVGIYAIYMLVVLGFLKGTEGPNQYGPDPLGNTAAAATA